MDEELGTRSDGCAGAGVTVLIIIAALAMMLCLCACRTTRVLEQVPAYMHDTTTVYRYQVRHDTLHSYTRDSVYMYTKGDTVYHNAVRYIDNSRVVYRCDTVHSNRVVERPVVVTKTQVKEVEKKLSKWQRLKMNLGGWLMAVVNLIVLVGGAYWIIKLKKIVK